MNRSSVTTRLIGLGLGVVLAATPFWAKAGTLTEMATALMAHRAEHAAEHAVTERMQSAAPVQLPPAGSFAACADLFPRGTPIQLSTINPAWRPVALCSGRYAVVYSELSKTPLMVIERLNRQSVNEALDEERTDHFYPDPRLARGARAELSDFTGSGEDRGHMAPAGDMPDQVAMAQSFALSNIVPQDPVCNRKGGAWFQAESATRKYVRRASGDVFVFSGPLFDGEHRTLGSHQVWVPTRLYKLVYDASTGRSWAHIVPNAPVTRLDHPVDYATFVSITNWRPLGNP